MLGKTKSIQLKKYRQFVEEQDTEQLLSFFEKTNLTSLLGDNKFVEWAKANFFLNILTGLTGLTGCIKSEKALPGKRI